MLLKNASYYLLTLIPVTIFCLPTNFKDDAESHLSRAIEALGGEAALSDLQGVIYHSPSLYRSRSAQQSYTLDNADRAVAITGHQNISFSYRGDGCLHQRIDRTFIASDYWTWGSFYLPPLDYSLVVEGGDSGFACFLHGNDQIYLPPAKTTGYADKSYAAYLILHGEMLSPQLLLRIKRNANYTSFIAQFYGRVEMPAIHDNVLDISVIFNSTSGLPYIVRTFEDHAVYGLSTNDLVLSDYFTTSGLQFPSHIQTVYNTSRNLNAPLEEYIVESVTINPAFASDLFDGLPANQSTLSEVAPETAPKTDVWQITEVSSNLQWGGSYDSELTRVETPVDGMPNVYWVVLSDEGIGMKQLILDYGDGLIVGDAPPQFTKSVIQWIQTNLEKPVTHIWPTHHHRDHSGGVSLYVDQGAKLLIPEIAADYWSSIPNASFVTFSDTNPFSLITSSLQIYIMWEPEAAHAIDFSYAAISPACPNATGPLVVFEPDAWNAGEDLGGIHMQVARQWLDQTNRVGLTANTIVLPTHGNVSHFQELVQRVVYPYPDYDVTDFMGGTFMKRCSP